MDFEFNFKELVIGNTIAGVEVSFNKDGMATYCFTIAKKTSKSAEVSYKSELYDSFEELANHLDKNTPIVLSIGGKGIIDKKVQIESYDSDKSILNQVLPNADHNSLYYQIYNGKDYSFISIIRKDMLVELIEQFKAAGYFTIDVIIGPFQTGQLLPLLDNELITNNSIFVGKHHYQFEEDQLIDCTSQANDSMMVHNVQLSGESFKDFQIPSFIAAVTYLIGESKKDLSEAIKVKEEYFHKVLFKLGAISSISILIIVMTAGLFFDLENKSKYAVLTQKMSKHEAQIIQIGQLKKELHEKRELLLYLGLIENSKGSFYSDRIASTMPKEISLKKMTLNPLLNNKDEFAKTLSFSEKTIEISGTTARSVTLNNWIKKLNKFDWIDNITIVDYGQDTKNEVGKFSLKVTLKK